MVNTPLCESDYRVRVPASPHLIYNKESMEFKKYYPELQARPSTLDTFVQCPLKSTLPADIDEFTSYIGKILHYSHQSPRMARGMIDLFMVDYKNITGENDNELRNMLLQYIDKGREFIKANKDNEIYYEFPRCTDIEWVWVSWTGDVVSIDEKKNMVEIIDFKTSKSPWTYKDVLEWVQKAQPFFYSYLACLLTGMSNAKFSYYVYGKGKKPKLYKHSRTFTVNELENECRKIIIQYKSSTQSWIFEARKCDHCFYCPIWPRKKQTCPLRQH